MSKRLLLLALTLGAPALADVAISGGQVNAGIYDGGVWVRDIEGNTAAVRQPSLGVGRLVVGLDEPIWSYNIEGTTVNSNLLEGSVTTHAIAQAVATGLTLNSASSAAASAHARMCSIQKFIYTNDKPLVFRTQFLRTTTTQLNEVVEMGFANMSAATTPTEGAYFRWTSAGNFVAVNTFNSLDTPSASLTAPTANVWHTATIVKRARDSRFYIDDVLVATVTAATADPAVQSSQLVGVCWRVSTTAGFAGTAPLLRIGPSVVFEEGSGGRDRETILVGMGRGAWSNPTTYVQTPNHANSTSPTSATLSNTAAGYTTLGGRYQFAMVASAATDFALFGWTNPTGYRLNVSSVSITACNTGAAVATTPTILDWGVAINASNVSLATTDTLGPPATAWAPRRIPLGITGWPLAAPNGPAQIGECADEIVRTFQPPLVVDSARFFHVIVQVFSGAATASNVIRGDVVVNGWFE